LISAAAPELVLLVIELPPVLGDGDTIGVSGDTSPGGKTNQEQDGDDD
jgi:hypothetical protein